MDWRRRLDAWRCITYRPRPIVNTLYRPGVQFVSLFCDDNKAPLPKSIVDLISSFAEKSVPESITRLYEIAKKLDESEKSIVIKEGKEYNFNEFSLESVLS